MGISFQRCGAWDPLARHPPAFAHTWRLLRATPHGLVVCSSLIIIAQRTRSPRDWDSLCLVIHSWIHGSVAGFQSGQKKSPGCQMSQQFSSPPVSDVKGQIGKKKKKRHSGKLSFRGDVVLEQCVLGASQIMRFVHAPATRPCSRSEARKSHNGPERTGARSLRLPR